MRFVLFPDMPKSETSHVVFQKPRTDLFSDRHHFTKRLFVASSRIEFQKIKTGKDIDLLKAELLLAAGWQPSGEGVFAARERHMRVLTQAQAHLQTARQHRTQLELLAEELRQAQQALSTITGEFTTDDLLGEIFSRFCIGK